MRIRRAELARDGHLVLSANVTGSPERLGVAGLPAGAHRNVTVAIDRPASVPDDEVVRLEATIHGDDGDGAFGGGDRPVRVGGEAVASDLAVVWREPAGDEGSASNDGPPIPGPGEGAVVAALVVSVAIARWRRVVGPG